MKQINTHLLRVSDSQDLLYVYCLLIISSCLIYEGKKVETYVFL